MNRRERVSAIVMGEDDNPLYDAKRFKKEEKQQLLLLAGEEEELEFNVEEEARRRRRELLQKAKRRNTLASIETLRRMKRNEELRRMRRQDRLRKELEARKKQQQQEARRRRKEDQEITKEEDSTKNIMETEEIPAVVAVAVAVAVVVVVVGDEEEEEEIIYQDDEWILEESSSDEESTVVVVVAVVEDEEEEEEEEEADESSFIMIEELDDDSMIIIQELNECGGGGGGGGGTTTILMEEEEEYHESAVFDDETLFLTREQDDEQNKTGQEQMQRASALLENFLVTTRHTEEVLRQAVPDEEEEKPLDREIGKISPSLQALISQASLELKPPPPKEHKLQYVPIATDAASIGRVTHLEEKVVEAFGKLDGEEISMKKTDASYDAWEKKHSRRGCKRMPLHVLTRSDSRNIVDEAAALGRMKSLRAVVVTNFEEDRLAPQTARQEEIDDLQDAHYDGARVVRTEYLMDRYVKVHRQSKARDWLPDFEEIRYNSLDDVDVPTEEQPELRIAENNLSRHEIIEKLPQAVAERYWGRHYRLERPGAMLKVRPGCFCRYCQSSNPYQTFAYQKRWAIGKIADHHPDGDEPTLDADPEQYGYIARLYLPCEEASEEEEDVVKVDLKKYHPCDLLPMVSQCSIDFDLDPVEETDDESFASSAGMSEAGSSHADAEEP